MENFVLNTIANFANQKGFSYLKGEYMATAKNEMVKSHYLNLGFKPKGSFWELSLHDFENRKTHINIKQ